MSPWLKKNIHIFALLILISAMLFLGRSNFSVRPALAVNNNATTTVIVVEYCGNGVIREWEICDPGDPARGYLPDVGTTTCQMFGYTSGTVACASDCLSYDISNCSTCGNSTREGTELCDGNDFGTATCLSVAGLNQGILKCRPNCSIDPGQCYSAGIPDPGYPPSGGGGGGGGGGGSGAASGFQPGANQPPLPTKVVIKGKAFPNSDVHILMDGKVIGIIKADGNADFSFETSEVAAGVATFSFWAENNEGIKSTAFSLTFRIVSGAVTTISGAYLAPTISVDKNKVGKGEIVNIFGQTIPNADIYITINSDNEIIKQVESDNIGAYLLPMDTSILEDEEFHLAKSLFQVSEGSTIIRSGYSNSVSFYVGTKGTAAKCAGADLNGDGRVNLTDFSILLYNWGSNNECSDQNSDGRVNLTDFSIMMYYWTG